jgi:hypothetical protein
MEEGTRRKVGRNKENGEGGKEEGGSRSKFPSSTLQKGMEKGGRRREEGRKEQGEWRRGKGGRRISLQVS